jgi:phage/plasmid-like protein (TIGR03299 family)
MAHEIEFVNGKAQMAFTGDVPWHGLGTRVPADLTPAQMLDAAGLNWTVEKFPAYANYGEGPVAIGRSALVRNSDLKMLDVVSDDWNPVQNEEAFEFFNDFVASGDMEMHTAGSLKGGQIVWGLAKVKESFDLFKGDTIDSYLLFSNFHKYGFSTDVRFTPIRVVCNNTLTLSLNSQVENMAKISHRKVFDGNNVKEMLGVAKHKLEQYKEMAEYLGAKRYNNESIVDYFTRIFPVTGSSSSSKRKPKEVSRNAELAMTVLENQPGTEYAPGTWWQAFNAVTYITDHVTGRNADNRLASAWYGSNRTLKTKALETAVEMAEAA